MHLDVDSWWKRYCVDHVEIQVLLDDEDVTRRCREADDVEGFVVLVDDPTVVADDGLTLRTTRRTGVVRFVETPRC